MAKLLFVDDEESIRALYEIEFANSGHELFFASSGEEAVEQFSEIRPALVVMDIRMPGMDGLEAMSRLVAIDNQIPVIIYSAHPHHKGDFSSWLADSFLVKSMDMVPLKNAIEAKLKESRK
jgi:two-component system, response regulator, stage 0 sporulation protein F